MRKLALVLVLAIPSLPASAASFESCWVSEIVDAFTGEVDQVTRCRISGGDTIDYVSDSVVPSRLYPNLGTDVSGQCWYYTSSTTAYVILDQFADGSANIGLDTDPGVPGGIIAIGPVLPRCTSEPSPDSDPAVDAWDYAMSYIHDPPTPDLNPEPGDGVTGMETFVGVSVPADHLGSLTSGTSTLEVDIVVDAVIVEWGDGESTTFPPDDIVLSGYPDGSASHIYEVKNADGAAVTVEYDWTARWRLAGGSWTPLPVPNTATTIDYPISEVVSRLGG